MGILISLFYSCSNKSGNDFAPELIPVKVSEKWGYVNAEGKYEINPQFSYAGFFIDNIALVASADKYGYIDEKGKFLINPQYKDASDFSEGLAAVVSENGKIKYINKKGDIKIELKDAEYAGNFHNGLAKVKINDQWGFIDNTGKIVINPQFYQVIDFTDGLSAFSKKDEKGEILWGYIDKTGKIIINAQFKSVEPFTDGLAAVSIDGKQFGFVDKTGKYIINPQFEEVTSFFNEIAAIKQGNSWGIINTEGKIIINPQFDEIILPASNDLIAVQSDEKWGYIDMDGKYVINPQFDEATNFIGKIAIVEFADKIGFIDTKGTYIANPQFDGSLSPKYFSCYGIGYSFNSIETDFFDINSFTTKLLPNNSMLGIDENSNVEIITKIFNLTTDDYGRRKVQISNTEILETEFSTKDITINKVTIEFLTDVYDYENKYEYYQDYWGNQRQRISGTTKTPNNEAKIKDIEIDIELSNKGSGKGENLAKELKTAFQKVYKFGELQSKKFEEENTIILTHKDNKYFSYIAYNEDYVKVWLSFDTEDNITILNNLKSEIEDTE